MKEITTPDFTEAIGNANEINELLRRYGVKFGIYKNGEFKEQFFPFDPIPRVIDAEQFADIEKGLIQRVDALNSFLYDIYHDKKIVRDGIIPEDFIYISSGCLSDNFTYQKDVTTAHTTAAEAFAAGAGVCQDFSHIMLSLLRMDGIPCRYIAGLAFCDGETHSWIEYFEDGCWKGFDPANNCLVNEDYLVLSQGRDFGDCAIDRGVMFGSYTRQLQLVRSVMKAS